MPFIRDMKMMKIKTGEKETVLAVVEVPTYKYDVMVKRAENLCLGLMLLETDGTTKKVALYGREANVANFKAQMKSL